jgi:hypothetical protein
MNTRHAYLALCALGTVLPCSQVVPWIAEHGLDIPLFVRELFASRVSAFFALDVVVSTLVLWTLVAVEGRRCGVRHLWAPVAASLGVGVSLGLPLFLYMRESKVGRSA